MFNKIMGNGKSEKSCSNKKFAEDREWTTTGIVIVIVHHVVVVEVLFHFFIAMKYANGKALELENIFELLQLSACCLSSIILIAPFV